jgi:hypothetical protein
VADRFLGNGRAHGAILQDTGGGVAEAVEADLRGRPSGSERIEFFLFRNQLASGSFGIGTFWCLPFLAANSDGVAPILISPG